MHSIQGVQASLGEKHEGGAAAVSGGNDVLACSRQPFSSSSRSSRGRSSQRHPEQ